VGVHLSCGNYGRPVAEHMMLLYPIEIYGAQVLHGCDPLHLALSVPVVDRDDVMIDVG